MKIQSFTQQISEDLIKYQNVLGKENKTKVYLPFINELVTADSFVVLGSRPRMGKTSLVLDFIVRNSLLPHSENLRFGNVCMGRKGLVFFLGHREDRLLRHWVSMVLQEVISPEEGPDLLSYYQEKYRKRIDGADIDFNFIEDTKDLSIKVREGIERTSPDYVVIDCLDGSLEDENYGMQLYEYRTYTYNNEHLLRLFQLQKEFKKFFLVTRMMGDELMLRSGMQRPMLEDFHSREIDINADLVIGLNRPELHGCEVDEDGNTLENDLEIIPLLNRYGHEGELLKGKLVNGLPNFNEMRLGEEEND